MEKHTAFSRRKFIASGGILLTGAALGLPSLARAAAPSAKIKLGLIGAGSRGTGLAALLKEIPEVELAACCDPIPSHLAQGMKLAAPGAKSYNNYKALLDNKEVDAVIIATPLYTHYEIAVAALDAGKHVYLEKSMTYDIRQSLALVKKVKASGKVFQVGFQYRYYDLYKRVKQAIDEQWLGTITGFECQYHQNSNWRRPNNDPALERAINWRMYREYCGGPLSELCAHQIDMVHYILGTHPVSVVGAGSINFWKDGRDTYDTIRTVYEYPGGIQSSVSSTLSNAYRDYNIRILGTRATIDISRNKALLYPEPRAIKRAMVDGVTNATVKAPVAGEELTYRAPGEPNPEPTIYALKDFAACIRDGKKPASNEETAHMASVAIIMGNAAADEHVQQVWKKEYDIV
ncbi:Gfo/Idh/MocA family oxidoreductase [Chitinophaga sp.]|uniref:Gfo/Idh/MocA family protein n=1 Tax=Chitinophaga sp. TaxID=1869181 RepID=UPI0031D7DF44